MNNCDTCRKARAWLGDRNIEHAFVDVRAGRLEAAALHAWLDAVGRDRLLNRRGTTWRGLSEADQAKAGDDGGALELMLAHPALIKRPVFVRGGQVIVGFGEAEKEALLA